MPNEKGGTQSNSLEDFAFDDDTKFFGIKPEGEDSQTSAVIKEVKKPSASTEDDDDDLESTDISKTGKKSKEGVKEIEEEDIPEDDDWFKETKAEDEEEEEDKKEVKPKKKSKEKEEEVEDEEDDKKKKKPKAKEELEEEEEEEDKKDIKPKPKKKEEPENEDQFFTTLVSELKDKKIFQNIELKEDETITEERFFELQDEEIEARVNETFEAFFEELDEDGKEFLKFKRNGGKTQDFLAVYSNPIDLATVDLENDDQRKDVIRYYLTSVEGVDAEELKDRLESLKDGGKEKIYAEKYLNKIKQLDKKAKEDLKKTVEENDKKKQESSLAFRTEFAQVLSKTEAVGAYTITKDERKSLVDYINKPTVKVGKNKYVPEFQASLAKILRGQGEDDKKKLALLAKLVKTDFSTEDLKNDLQTTVTKRVKSKLIEAKKGVKAASSGAGSQTKSMADYF